MAPVRPPPVPRMGLGVPNLRRDVPGSVPAAAWPRCRGHVPAVAGSRSASVPGERAPRRAGGAWRDPAGAVKQTCTLGRGGSPADVIKSGTLSQLGCSFARREREGGADPGKVPALLWRRCQARCHRG